MTVARLARNVGELSDQVEALSERVDNLSIRVDQRFEQVDQRFEQVDQRFEQVDQRFEQVDQRFDQVDQRFDRLRADIRSDFEEFVRRIEHSFKVSLEGMEAKLNAALDGNREQARRLDVFEGTNAGEHRLMQAQIDDLNVRVQARSRRRRPS